MVVEPQQSGSTNQDVFCNLGFVQDRVYFVLEAVVGGFSRGSSIPERRRVLRTPPRFCLSKVSATSRVLRIRWELVGFGAA